MVVDSTGHVIVAGCANDGHATAAIAIKYAPDGSRVWTSHRFGQVALAASRGVAVDAAGDVYMTGYVFSGSNSRDIVTAKYDGATGAMLWGKRFDSAGQNDEPQALVLDSQGDVIVAGFVTRTDGNQDLLVMKWPAAMAISCG